MRLRAWKMIIIVLMAGLLPLLPVLSFAQQFPTKPINLLVAFSLGLTTDTSTRMLASKAEKVLGQPFVISNNAAAGGSVALGITAKEKPDGYHLVSTLSPPLVLMPHIRSVPYKLDDFSPIMHFGVTQSGLVVRSDSPWKSLRELVDYAKKNPWKVTYAVMGTGTAPHIAMEYVAKQEGGIPWTLVPYKSDPNVPLLGGHVSAYSGGSGWTPHVKSGTLRLLATHGEKRMKTFPDVPTIRELGYDFVNPAVYMFTAPKGTPLSITKKLDDAFRKAMDDPEFVRYMEQMELEITYRNHEDLKKYLEGAYDRFGKIVAELKIPKESETK